MRKPHQEEHVDAEKWAIPYADLLTLLLAFFVVMYSLSSVNEGKFRILAESMRQAFHGTGQVIGEAQVSVAHQAKLPNDKHATGAMPIARVPVPVPPHHAPAPGDEGAASKADAAAQTASLNAIANDVAKALHPWVVSKQVIIRKTKQWLEIEIRTDVLFPSGVAHLAAPARKVLAGVAGAIAPFPNPIRIEGYTDNRPIDTWKFPSNWELSAARAGSVARLFSDHGVDPGRIAIFGWGETHPVASNATPEGRNRNRRIAIVVLGDHGAPKRYYSTDSQPVAAAPTSATPSMAASDASAAGQALPAGAKPQTVSALPLQVAATTAAPDASGVTQALPAGAKSATPAPAVAPHGPP